MKEEVPKTGDHLQGERLEFQLEEGLEKDLFKAVVIKYVLLVTRFHESLVLLLLHLMQAVRGKREKQVSFFFVKSILHKDLPQQLESLGGQQFEGVQANQRLKELKALAQVLVEGLLVGFACYHFVKEVTSNNGRASWLTLRLLALLYGSDKQGLRLVY